MIFVFFLGGLNLVTCPFCGEFETTPASPKIMLVSRVFKVKFKGKQWNNATPVQIIYIHI